MQLVVLNLCNLECFFVQKVHYKEKINSLIGLNFRRNIRLCFKCHFFAIIVTNCKFIDNTKYIAMLARFIYNLT